MIGQSSQFSEAVSGDGRENEIVDIDESNLSHRMWRICYFKVVAPAMDSETATISETSVVGTGFALARSNSTLCR
jgi:hypothetical protein